MGQAIVALVWTGAGPAPPDCACGRLGGRRGRDASVHAGMVVRPDGRGRVMALPVDKAMAIAGCRTVSGRRHGCRAFAVAGRAGDGRRQASRRCGSRRNSADLRDRAGDYVRDLLAEASGFDGDPAELGSTPFSDCSNDACVAVVDKEGAQWRILATRSAYRIDWDQLTSACSEADIVVSDRRLPRGCEPRWLRLDPETLSRNGGLAIHLSNEPRADTVADRVGHHPWAEIAR